MKFAAIFSFLLAILLFNEMEIIFPQVPLRHISSPVQQNPKFQKAREYYYQGKYAMAMVFLEDLSLSYPEEAEIYTYLGDALYHLKKYPEALLNYRKANEILPKIQDGQKIKAQNYFQMGNIYFLLRNAESAMAHFELAAMTDAGMIMGYWEKGYTALFLLRDKEATVKAWQEYLLLVTDPKEKEKVTGAINLLKKPEFKLPPEGSPLSLEEALKGAGILLKTKVPEKANENKRD
jgi:tetratricopeptide (TPR) repeat protein